MKRFFLTISQAVELVLKSSILAQGGDIFVLKMPTLLIKDLIEVIIEDYCKIIGKDPNLIKIELIGPRPGEKMDEELISHVEFSYCYETEDMYIIYPSTHFGFDPEKENVRVNGSKIVSDENFIYNTVNSDVLTKEEIRKLLKEHKLI